MWKIRFGILGCPVSILLVVLLESVESDFELEEVFMCCGGSGCKDLRCMAFFRRDESRTTCALTSFLISGSVFLDV